MLHLPQTKQNFMGLTNRLSIQRESLLLSNQTTDDEPIGQIPKLKTPNYMNDVKFKKSKFMMSILKK